MKKKKSMFALALIAMVLVLGVGYAVISGVTLTISGSASTETKDLDVVISAANPNDTTKDVYGTVSNPNDLNATIHVANMKKVGETQTVTYTITNNEDDVAAEISKKSITPASNEYFEVTTSVDSTTVIAQPKGTTTVDVTVRLKKIPLEAADATANIEVKLDAAAVQPS